MKNRLIRWGTMHIAGMSLLLFTSQVWAQPSVHEIPESELTANKLIEVLQPPVMRGIGTDAPTGAPTEAPNCTEVRQRGVTAEAITEVAAIKVEFAFNSAELTPAALSTLDKVGEALKSGALAPYCFRVEGHADAIGTDEYNLVLSQRRADSVVRYLAGRLGVAPDRLIAVGYGEKQPLGSNDTEEGRQLNRRVQIANLGNGTASN